MTALVQQRWQISVVSRLPQRRDENVSYCRTLLAFMLANFSSSWVLLYVSSDVYISHATEIVN